MLEGCEIESECCMPVSEDRWHMMLVGQFYDDNCGLIDKLMLGNNVLRISI